MAKSLAERRASDGSWSSLILLGRGILRRWWLVVVGFIFGGVETAERVTGEPVDLPAVLTYGVMGLSLGLAAVLTFHEERTRALALTPASSIDETRAGLLQAREHLAERRRVGLELRSRHVGSEDEVQAWEAEYEAWQEVTCSFIAQSFGRPEVLRFKDPGTIPEDRVLPGAYSRRHHSLLLWIDVQRDYLNELGARLIQRLDRL